jgi:hypothetical protein
MFFSKRENDIATIEDYETDMESLLDRVFLRELQLRPLQTKQSK